MCPALIFFALRASFFLVPVKADFPLAVGGHGNIFLQPGVPLANVSVWIEVETPNGWTNATFPNATEVRVDAKTGAFELEAIVGDARRRHEIKGLRLFVQEPISRSNCRYRDVEPAYMYLYKPGRAPSRPFSHNVTLLEQGDVARWLTYGEDADFCFHRRLAVDVSGTIMCNESEPIAFARMGFHVKWKNWTEWRTVLTILERAAPTTWPDVSCHQTLFPGPVRDRDEIEGLRLWFENLCENVNRSSIDAKIPLDFMYAYEEHYDYKTFIYNAQLDIQAFHQGQGRKLANADDNVMKLFED